MYKQVLLILIIAHLSPALKAQDLPGRLYRDHVFADVDIKKDLSYNPGPATAADQSNLFDWYEPMGDRSAKRPLMIWMHGGGFKYGSKTAKGIRLWSRDFAQRGYVCAAINYRLSRNNPVFHFDELQSSCYYAVQDAKAVIAYLKAHADEYRIDTSRIILAGNSAGGIIALQAAYSSNAELSRRTGVVDSTVVSKQDDRAKVAGVINFWGGMLDIRWLKNAKVPIFSAYGSKDHILNPMQADTCMYGSKSIHDMAGQLHIVNRVKVFDGVGHELQRHFNPFFNAGKPTQKRWLEAAQLAANFYYTILFNPKE